MIEAILLAAATLVAPTGSTAASNAPSAVEDGKPEIDQAENAFSQFADAYRAEEYRTQWRLLDPRKRRWIKWERWRNFMDQSRRRHGKLLSVIVTDRVMAQAHQLPCTEMGHCYRKGVTYAVFILQTVYALKPVAQPEFAVMSLSDEGWRFAGGTFPATAMGETGVLLDGLDEKRFLAQQRSPKRN